MSDSKYVELAQELLAKFNTQKRELERLSEPVAIVGMACRFPGGRDLAEFWRQLDEGRHSATQGRRDRIADGGPAALADGGWGSYIQDIDRFDAEFFRIAPVEARLLDPQQRLLLETSWEALEDAGIDPRRLRGSRSGVFAGISTNDYWDLIAESARAAGGLYSATGNSGSTAIGRVAFTLGLEGPAVAIDTACSSSLVAIHQAVSSLQRGEVKLALAGGVNAILVATLTEPLVGSGMISADGRCKTFDASADGYGRGEGCGMVVLKRLGDAEADGDRIWGVIRGTAVNQDGASSGLTVPNGPAQERVIRDALSRSGLEPAEVDYLEAHGTGTELGDPIEIHAAAAVYGKGRQLDNPLLIGSVKTNIGHLEAAAGAAGLIKLALSMSHGTIPKHLHFEKANPRVDWHRLPVQVTCSAMPWPLHPGRPFRAGLSSFGFSGTNAHLVMESHGPPAGGTAGQSRAVPVPNSAIGLEPTSEATRDRGIRFLPLSGKSATAVEDLARRYQSWLDTSSAGDAGTKAAPESVADSILADLAWTAGVGRSHFEHRAGLPFRNVADLRRQLTDLVGRTAAPGPRRASKVAFVFTGQGSQWPGMGRELYESEPMARAVLDRCDEVIRELRGESLLDVMFGCGTASERLADTAWSQPALFALECALVEMWASVGVRPSAVLGHSVGELAAACAAGVFSLEDGLLFAAGRGDAMASLPAKGRKAGAMLAVFAPAARVESAVRDANAHTQGVGLSLAADNGTHQVVSGPAALVGELSKRLVADGVRVEQLQTSHGFHSGLMDPALDGIGAALRGISLDKPSVPLVSNLTGRAMRKGERLDAGYWRRQAREPVAFAGGVASLAAMDIQVVIEIGPRPVLGPLVDACWPETRSEKSGQPGPEKAPRSSPPVVISSLKRTSVESETRGRPLSPEATEADGAFAAAVARAYESGMEISFDGLFAGENRRKVSAPTYPFQRQRYWVDRHWAKSDEGSSFLLGNRRDSANGEITFETELFASDPDWLGDHRVFGRVVAPGALQGALAAAAASAVIGSESIRVSDLRLHAPLIFPEPPDESGRILQVVLGRAGSAATRPLEVFTKGADETAWTLHAEGEVSEGEGLRPGEARVDLVQVQAGLAEKASSDFYDAVASADVDYGPSFRGVNRIWLGAGEALGEVVLSEAVDSGGLHAHPTLLDGCLQVMAAALGAASDEGPKTYLPIAWEELWLPGPLPASLMCHVSLRGAGPGISDAPESEGIDGNAGSRSQMLPEALTGDIRLCDPAGVVVGEVVGLTAKRATRDALLSAVESVTDLMYEVVWREGSLSGAIQPADFLESPDALSPRIGSLQQYLAAEGLELEAVTRLFVDLERLSQGFALAALESLGWRRQLSAAVVLPDLRRGLGVTADHELLLRRLCEMLADARVLAPVSQRDAEWVVVRGEGEPLPERALRDPQRVAGELRGQHPYGATEIGLLSRCGAALSDVLRGRRDPLALLFSEDSPSAADFYQEAPVMRGVNAIVGDAVSAVTAGLPAGRRLRVLEVGAGTGGTTASVLPALPKGRFDYVYTDISAGFFAGADERFGPSCPSIEYRVLDIETDPAEQGFRAHTFDLVIAANVLHTTRDLAESLAHCRCLLAPCGQLVALEGLRQQGWLDLTFGLLDGWWRFSDRYRSDSALVGEAVWRRALADAGFGQVTVLGAEGSGGTGPATQGVIVAEGPPKVTDAPGLWLLAEAGGDMATDLAAQLAARNQTVVVASRRGDSTSKKAGSASFDPASRESWRELVEGLAEDPPFCGVVHVGALEGDRLSPGAEDLSAEVARLGESSLALVQGLVDAGNVPSHGVWFVTRGAQVLGRERAGELAGATLWGFARTVALEAPQLQPRMIDLDAGSTLLPDGFADELLRFDGENQIAYRREGRHVARLVRSRDALGRVRLPDEGSWQIEQDPGDGVANLRARVTSFPSAGAGEVRASVKAAGLNFFDVMAGLGIVGGDGSIGVEFCGRLNSVGPDIAGLSPGDTVVGFGLGTFASEVVTLAELVTPVPRGLTPAEAATLPAAFVTAELAFDSARLAAGDRVLVHAGAGGVGQAAIQLARAAGAEVYATASAPKQEYLRSQGVAHVFDSRTTAFGQEILQATGGAGVSVVLNSLTGPGFIEASLECLETGGRFVELGKRDIWSEEAMAAARPDVVYQVMELDRTTAREPGRVGAALRSVADRVGSGALTPLDYSAWPLAGAGAAMEYMRSGRHLGKIVLTGPPLGSGRLREHGTYLVTGGLGGIGREVAGWLAAQGAGTIVLNGRREPDDATRQAVEALRQRGVTVRVEIADVTDDSAVEAMLQRVESELPPLAGVIHSVGVLADASIQNQSWERFERVLRPKVLGAWLLHRATQGLDLDFFLLFSSMVGVLGNVGQANHAAANAYLDQLARHRRALGLPGQAIAWSVWSGLGEAEEQRDRISEQVRAAGGGWISPQRGLRALGHLVRQDVGTSAVVSVDWATLAALLPGPAPLLAELVAVARDRRSPSVGSKGALVEGLLQAPAQKREELMTSFVQQELQAVLRLSSLPETSVGFFDLGMDSLMAVELRNRLNQSLSGSCVVSNTAVFDHPDIASLARHLAAQIAGPGDEVTATDRVEAERIENEPIAIIGMACRFPGGSDLAGFWRLLESGGHAVSEGRPRPALEGLGRQVGGDHDAGNGRHWGAFIEGIDQFDAEFFRVAPVEARLMDPQHRLLLETSWKALEDAGIDPGRLRGSRTGVFAGISSSDYRALVSDSEEVPGLHATTGNASSTAIGRVAFTLGLEGPAVAVDTACSSSLVALHQAVAGLQRNDADLALAGGVSAILLETPTEAFAAAGMLAADGRCKTFDASADGYVRGEGCGMVILKRASEAERDGDRIWGFIRGAAVNQDGASAGLTVPNGPAQERLIADALSRAGLEPSDVDYLEAHGTGTELGDPVEVHAAAAVYCRDRDAERPLLVGSVKTNIGHLEAAAGIAGLIKVILSMNRGVIPRHLHFEEPNPRIDWDRFPVRVSNEATDWPFRPGQPARAAVSSFGFSGTNAHIVVEAGVSSEGADSPADSDAIPIGMPLPVVAAGESGDQGAGPRPPRAARFLPLSGKTPEAVRSLAGRYLAWVEEHVGNAASDEADTAALLADMAWTASTGRSHFDHRAGLAFGDVAELRSKLTRQAEAGAVPKSLKKPRVAFLFSGQGSQRSGMGKELYYAEPAVRSVLDRCDHVMRDLRGSSLLDVMFGRDNAAGDLDDTAWTQPALYALECALAAMWSSAGVRPDAVLGHSVGEIAAAQSAGVFGLEEGLRFAAARGELMGSLPAEGPNAGAMLAVFADSTRVAAALEQVNAELDGCDLNVAADNGTHQVVSGQAAGVERVARHLNAEGVRSERLNTSHAFHSALMEPILDDLETVLQGIPLEGAEVPFVSNVTGRVAEADTVLDGAYWRRQAREPVLFSDGIATLSELGINVVVEIGPQPTLGPSAALAWPAPAADQAGGSGGDLPSQSSVEAPSASRAVPIVLATLARPPDASRTSDRSGSNGSAGEAAAVAEAAGGLYEAGIDLSFEGLFAGEARRRIAVPTYPFQHRRHWFGSTGPRRSGDFHPLLGARHELPRGEITFERGLRHSDPAWLADHRVFGHLVVPGALHGSLAMAAAGSTGPAPWSVERLRLHAPLVLGDGETASAEEGSGRLLQVVLGSSGNGPSRSLEVFSRGGGEEAWTLHAECDLVPGLDAAGGAGSIDPESLKDALTPSTVSALYGALARMGVEHGPAFRSVEAVWSGSGEALGEVALPAGLAGHDLQAHPSLLDGCFQVLAGAAGGTADDSRTTYLPFAWDRMWLKSSLPERVLCHVRIDKTGSGDPPVAGRSDGLVTGQESIQETLRADFRIYALDGSAVGAVDGFTAKRATRLALLGDVERLDELSYEVIWREQPLASRSPALVASPHEAVTSAGGWAEYLAQEDVDAEEMAAFLDGLEQLSRAYARAALEELGWQSEADDAYDVERLCRRFRVVEGQRRLLGRLLEIQSEADVPAPERDGGKGRAGPARPDLHVDDPERIAAGLARLHAFGSLELDLLGRCGTALPDVLRGRVNPSDLVFGDTPARAGYQLQEAPLLRATIHRLADVVAALTETLPGGHTLRVLEIAGTGGVVADAMLSALPQGRFDYVCTAASADVLAGIQARVHNGSGQITFRQLNIESEPEGQGFEANAYDLLIAANQLHATRDLGDTLRHCRKLLAPSGQLVALEGLQARRWLDLTFGLLEDRWRFDDAYRTNHALAGEEVWRRALAVAGFGEVAVLDAAATGSRANPVHAVIVGRGSAIENQTEGAWLIAGDGCSLASELAASLTARNQEVVVACEGVVARVGATGQEEAALALEDPTRRESWRLLLEALPTTARLRGVVHLSAGHGQADPGEPEELARIATDDGASALALVQGLLDAESVPTGGVWFVTKGAQAVERQRHGSLAGATLWGFGKAMAWEAPQLQPRMIDLDPLDNTPPGILVEELLGPDRETHIAYRRNGRFAARLVRSGDVPGRIRLPEESPWRLVRDGRGIRTEEVLLPAPQQGEIQVAVSAAGINAADVPSAESRPDGALGSEMFGRVAAVGPGTDGIEVGDRVVGFAQGAFGPYVTARAELVVRAPSGLPDTAIATVPTAFVTATLALQLAKVDRGEKVLVHVGINGVGQAAIQLARAKGAAVYATASPQIWDQLESLGAAHVIRPDAETLTAEILELTGGTGVDVILNELAGRPLVEASLACLSPRGRFIETAAERAWSAEQMSEAHPDVVYHVLDLARLASDEPALVRAALQEAVDRIESNDFKPVPHQVWAVSESGAVMDRIESGTFVEKAVLTLPRLAEHGLRDDASYLITGGTGGIGLQIAGWLADRGAGAIILNGRSEPSAEAQAAVQALRDGGARVELEVADVSDALATDKMLDRIDDSGFPLAGVVHCAATISDGSLANQTWERFATVLEPKVFGAWNLHCSTAGRDLDFFVLFSSLAGVLGNPGQANYAAANAFLDHLASYRRASGLPGQSIAWGTWSGPGLAGEGRARIAARMADAGLGWITPLQGLRAFDRLLGQEVAASMVAPVDWPLLASSVPAPPALLEEVIRPTKTRQADSAVAPDEWLARLQQAPPPEREKLLVAFLQGELQAVLRLPSPPESTVGFFDLGMDSLMAVEWRNRLNSAFGGSYEVPSTVAFDYPDTATLAHHLSAAIGGLPGTQETPREQPRDGQEIAIVGMACRFPGSGDLSAFWRALEAGESACTEGRPISAAGRGVGPFREESEGDDRCMWGAFIDGIDRFDAEFFRIAPVEAILMDPQQRLLLETSWHALEDAAIAPGLLKGSRSGVFAGISTCDYRDLVVSRWKAADGPYAATGNSYSAAIGRVAFALGLEGPALAVDTACSSSLVAIHQAAASLQRRETDLALAGGVNAILSAGVTEAFATAGMLAADGRCKTFDAAADGYVRGEGCGMVVLKRLEDAEADGDRIWAVLKGSAINQDGASAGLTVPNGPAQERVIAEALARAAVEPAAVDYLEAHGTGTRLGDPIELNAAAAVYGQGRRSEQPLLIGSVKTNVGHLEAAAGVAGLIKAVLSMSRRVIPPHLNFRDPNPHVDWNHFPLRVASERLTWPSAPDRPPLAAVSSFGFSGTNAHVVVEGRLPPYGDGSAALSWPGVDRLGPARRVTTPRRASETDVSPRPVAVGDRSERMLPLSGKSAAALQDLARRYLDWLEHVDGEFQSGEGEAPAALADIAWTAGVGRSHLAHRAGLVFGDIAELRSGLADLAEGPARSRAGAVSKVAFAFTGQGSQWAGMGQALYRTEPVVQGVLDQCDRLIRERRGVSLLDVMFGRQDAGGDLDDTAWTQPALYGLQCALVALWDSVGIRPDIVLGHSVGELAAAWAAGAFDLEDGLRLAAVRGELMSGLPDQGLGSGSMAAVFASRARVENAVGAANAEIEGVGLSVAADNITHQVVSGPLQDVKAMAERFVREGARVEIIETRHGFHSALIEPALDDLEAAAAGIGPVPAGVALISCVTGLPVGPTESLDGSYWRRQARERVAFGTAAESLASMDADVVVEIGPHPVLLPMMESLWEAGGDSAKGAAGSLAREANGSSVSRPFFVPSLRGSASDTRARSAASERAFATAAAGLYEAGAALAFEGLFAGETRRRVTLPCYPFQRVRYWIGEPRRSRQGGHPLLGLRHDSPRGETSFETELFASDPQWLSDHRVFGRVAAPAALQGVLAAACVHGGNGPAVVTEFQLHAPLLFPESAAGPESDEPGRAIQVVLGQTERGAARRIEIFSKGSESDVWTLHAEGSVSGRSVDPGSPIDLEALKSGLSPEPVSEFYAGMASKGIEYGPAFRRVEALWSGDGEAVGELAVSSELDRRGLQAHPTLLDGCFQLLAATAGSVHATYLPVGWDRLSLLGPLPDRLICHARSRGVSEEGSGSRRNAARSSSAAGDSGLPEVLVGDLWLYGIDGAVLGGVSGFTVKRATPVTLLSAADNVAELLYGVAWRDRPLRFASRSARLLAAPGSIDGRAPELGECLSAEGLDTGDLIALQSGLERLSRLYALAALGELGWRPKKGAPVDPDALQGPLKVVPSRLRLFRRLFALAAEAGALERRKEGSAEWFATAGSKRGRNDKWAGQAADLASSLVERHPYGSREIGLLASCGAALASLLTGQADPLELLFGDSAVGANELYREAPAMRAVNRLVGEAVAALAAGLPEGASLRILEVGAGTGSTTAAVLEKLPPRRIHYVFTDVSASFFTDAEARYAGKDASFECRVLDIELDPLEQGFDGNDYDLVIAANVLHATRDLGVALQHCRHLLAPSGQLVLLEGLRRQGWLDLTFGILDGWWRFDDSYRTDHPLVSAEVWRQALADAGFEDPTVLGDSKLGASEAAHGAIIARAPAEVVERRGSWVIATQGGDLGRDLTRRLVDRNQSVVLAGDGATASEAAEANGVVPANLDMMARKDWRSLFDHMPVECPFRGVVHLAATGQQASEPGPSELADGMTLGSASALALMQGLAEAGSTPSQGVWLVTRGAQVVGRDSGMEIGGAALWGFGRTAAVEMPHLKPRMIDLDGAESVRLDALVDELLHPDDENQIAYRGAVRHVPRVTRHSERPARMETSKESLPAVVANKIRADRTYLITGGLGGIGLYLASWLQDRGAGAVVLNGRRQPSEAANAAITALRDRGAEVRVEVADVTDASAVEAMLGRIESDLPPIAGVIHSVGLLADGSLANQTWERFERVLWPKVLGAWHLHQATAGRELDLFVLFSSMTGVLGNAGQANHAAANAFLDQLARYRKRLGLAGQSVAWGPWSGIGEADERRALIEEQLEAAGIGWIGPRQGVQALERLVRGDVTTSMVTLVDWPVFAGRLEDSLPILEELLPVSSRGASRSSGSAEAWMARLGDARPAEREALVVSLLQEELQAVLRLASPPEPTVGFFDLGMDSLMAVEFRNRLNRIFPGTSPVSSTVVFDHSDPASLARHLINQLSGLASAPESREASGASLERERVEALSSEDLLAEALAAVKKQK
uniref:SA1_PKSB n=1 Tax=uncultured bacterial symbiont of Discodermia dissoluta TaxID=323654 RepID=Q49HL1_9BACT|nr:SA1_PKSB [uncultured bacterial symbiont of Discodermia dissoluta]